MYRTACSEPFRRAHLAQDVLDRAASWTWERIEQGDEARLKFREESITESNLFEIQRIIPGVQVRKFTSHEERKNGADWAWWIGSDTIGWICLRIQAKRVHGKAYEYLEHPHTNEAGIVEYQHESLIKDCEAENSAGRPTFPFHVFYNGWDEHRFNPTIDFPKRFAARQRSHQHIDRCWGCAAVSSYDVSRILSTMGADRLRVDSYADDCFPWSELFWEAADFVPGWALHDGTEFGHGRTGTVEEWLDGVHTGLRIRTELARTMRARPTDSDPSEPPSERFLNRLSQILQDVPRQRARDRVSALPPYFEQVRRGTPQGILDTEYRYLRPNVDGTAIFELSSTGFPTPYFPFGWPIR
ncbi:DUF6615 family protein [Rhodococcus aetherivorans]|uniref:DUF6615 family protein n=1 Tax=Rhodococcus aetherivorans TaxID=191292 RepID=UPI00163A6884|nr:DUF6615 family protein [Rhodococcus aetherivorans]MBC2590404.1 hypothetical protein [Rhodococcus aetherivorans]